MFLLCSSGGDFDSPSPSLAVENNLQFPDPPSSVLLRESQLPGTLKSLQEGQDISCTVAGVFQLACGTWENSAMHFICQLRFVVGWVMSSVYLRDLPGCVVFCVALFVALDLGLPVWPNICFSLLPVCSLFQVS